MNEQQIFVKVLAQTDPADRLACLEEACQGNLPLRQRVEVLLQAHDRAGQFLESPAGGPRETIPFQPLSERPGTVIGRYKLLEQIGEGGMGSVWVAEQTEPVKRRVALKLIKPGMDTRQVLSRFEAERQALALMDHPNIAKVFDGGMTDEGRPFFVMEYVKGLPITQYCDDARLTVADRLALFTHVCQAVQHAHQKGIIHRDLKPSNILVCLYDGQPVPKVIDFGLAKAMHQSLTEHTLYTAHGLMVGTPLYMSPEQAEFNNLDIDTRSDIYSLGVILYELLTGTTPLERQQFKDAAWQEMLRLIKEQEPPRPSVRLSGSGSLPSLAAQRSLDPAKLTKTVRGELDWIVMKALEKDRGRRYETTNGLARDIERYLADEPVQACPPSAGYRFRKFARRYRAPLAVGAATMSALIVVTAVSLMAAGRFRNLARRNADLVVEKDQALKTAIAAEATARQTKVAEANLRHQAEVQRRDATTQLYRSLVNEASALRLARSPGYRHTVWDRLNRARLLDTPDVNLDRLRREAVRCLGDYVGAGPFVIEGFQGKIRGIALDPETARIAVRLLDGPVSIRSIATGEEIGRLGTKKPTDGIFPMCFDHHGTALLTASEAERITIWRPDATGQWTPKDIRLEGRPVQIHRARDGTMVVVSRSNPADFLVHAIDDNDATVSTRFRVPGTLGRIAYSAQTGTALAAYLTPENQTECRRWDTTTNDAEGELVRSLGATGTLIFSSDGSRLLRFGGNSVSVFDSRTHDRISSVNDQAILASVISPDNHHVAYVPTQINVVRVWNASANRQVAALRHPDLPLALAFGVDGRSLVTASESRAYIWRMDTSENLNLLGHYNLPTDLAFSPDGNRLISIGHDGTLRVWELPSGRLLTLIRLPDLGQCVAFSPDGRLLAVTGTRFLRLWETNQWQPVADIDVPSTMFSSEPDFNRLWCLAFSADGQYFAAGGNGLCVWRVVRDNGGGGGAVSFELVARPSEQKLRHICFSPDNKLLTWTEGGVSRFNGQVTMNFWNLDTSQRLDPLPTRLFSDIFSMDYFDDSRRVVLFNESRVPEIWDVVKRKMLFALEDEIDELQLDGSYNNHLDLSSNGRWLAADSRSGGVNLWEINSKKLLLTLPGEGSTVTCVKWNPGSDLLAVARSDMSVAVWNIKSIRSQLQKIHLDWKDN